MLLRILRFLRGYVSFSVSGKYPERFLNIASRSRIRLWNVRRKGEGFTACMYRSEYRGVRSAARGAGVHLRLIRKYGLPVYVRRYRDRVGVIIGACTFLLTLFIMSLFIWSVDISGLDRVSYTEMTALLRDQGVYVGAFKPGLDYQQIARNILLEKREVGWMAVNVTGSYASVEIKEEAPAPEVPDVSVPCNIKAKSDGVILHIEAMEGDAVLTEGSGVIEGQLIVSGVREGEQGTSRLVHADARVIARTVHEASFSTPSTFLSLRPDGETAERRSVSLFGLELPYRLARVSSPYAVADRMTQSPAPLDIRLPVGVTTETVSAMNYEETTLDENSARELLSRQADLYAFFALSDCTVESRNLHLTASGDRYTLQVTYTCIEDIACEEPIGTDAGTE